MDVELLMLMNVDCRNPQGTTWSVDVQCCVDLCRFLSLSLPCVGVDVLWRSDVFLAFSLLIVFFPSACNHCLWRWQLSMVFWASRRIGASVYQCRRHVEVLPESSVVTAVVYAATTVVWRYFIRNSSRCLVIRTVFGTQSEFGYDIFSFFMAVE